MDDEGDYTDYPDEPPKLQPEPREVARVREMFYGEAEGELCYTSGSRGRFFLAMPEDVDTDGEVVEVQVLRRWPLRAYNAVKAETCPRPCCKSVETHPDGDGEPCSDTRRNPDGSCFGCNFRDNADRRPAA